jgi:D-methionine transport system permease protein
MISLLGYSAMAGVIGGGGLGDLAIRYGYQRFRADVMAIAVVAIIALVELIQWAGSRITSRIKAAR